VKVYDCSIIQGIRTVEQQERLFNEGSSKTMKSKHLMQKDGFSHAVDVAPYPIDWNDTKRFYHFAGAVQERARQLGLDIRWGGDWDSDQDLNDQTFNDLVHWEIDYYA
jgi:peptidoglycan L-alanyl-D-glutamate endopeptidase CwlK